MDYTILGRTDLRVSVMGLGCGGRSRLGRNCGKTEQESVEIVRQALAHGINVFDTAEGYGTEEILRKGLRGMRREDFVISTKKTSARGDDPVPAGELAPSLERSLRKLGVDCVDIYHLHALSPTHYDYAVHQLVPQLLKLRGEGKLRFLGVTEGFSSDPGHGMLARAVRDDCWDVVMVGFNILNQSARERVLDGARKKDIGVLVMFALRRALSDPARLREALADLSRRGLVDRGLLGREALDFLTHEGGATTLQDAAYRFCRYEPGVHVVLSGTGTLEHLESNVASLCRPPLPAEDAARLREIFAKVDDVSGS